MKYFIVVFLLVLIPISAFGFSQESGFPEYYLEPGESATYQWELNSQQRDPVPIRLYATEEGADLLSFEKRILLIERKYVSIPITITVPENYPLGYYEPWMHALMEDVASVGGIIFSIAMIKHLKITVIPPQSQYNLDLQIGKKDHLRNVLGDLTFINGTLNDLTVTIYNEKGELTFNDTASISTNSEDDMLQNGATIQVESITNGIAHDREFDLSFTPTDNADAFDVSGLIYTIHSENGTIYRTVPIQSGTLTLLD